MSDSMLVGSVPACCRSAQGGGGRTATGMSARAGGSGAGNGGAYIAGRGRCLLTVQERPQNVTDVYPAQQLRALVAVGYLLNARLHHHGGTQDLVLGQLLRAAAAAV